MRIVLDTNVVVSALLWGGNPLRVMSAAVDGDVSLWTSPALLEELFAVLHRGPLSSRLNARGSSVAQAIELYAALAITVVPSVVPRIVPDDPDDDHVLAAAVAARADLLVTGDRHMLRLVTHADIRLVGPAEAALLIDLPSIGTTIAS